MRTGHEFHVELSDKAKAVTGAGYRCVDIGAERPDSLQVELFFPDDVPVEKLVAIADLINDALDCARADQEDAA